MNRQFFAWRWWWWCSVWNSLGADRFSMSVGSDVNGFAMFCAPFDFVPIPFISCLISHVCPITHWYITILYCYVVFVGRSFWWQRLVERSGDLSPALPPGQATPLWASLVLAYSHWSRESWAAHHRGNAENQKCDEMCRKVDAVNIWKPNICHAVPAVSRLPMPIGSYWIPLDFWPSSASAPM